MTLWAILFYTWSASEVLIAIRTRTRQGNGGSVQDRGSLAILWLTIVTSISACQWIAATRAPNLSFGASWAIALATVIIVAGLAIRGIAILSLGKAFSANVAIRDAQTLNTSGLYSLVRHPSYLGLLLVFLAIGIHARNWLALLFAVVIPTAALLYRIHVEEAALQSAFGAAYTAYSQRTKRLIPGIL